MGYRTNEIQGIRLAFYGDISSDLRRTDCGAGCIGGWQCVVYIWGEALASLLRRRGGSRNGIRLIDQLSFAVFKAV